MVLIKACTRNIVTFSIFVLETKQLQIRTPDTPKHGAVKLNFQKRLRIRRDTSFLVRRFTKQNNVSPYIIIFLPFDLVVNYASNGREIK